MKERGERVIAGTLDFLPVRLWPGSLVVDNLTWANLKRALPSVFTKLDERKRKYIWWTKTVKLTFYYML